MKKADPYSESNKSHALKEGVRKLNEIFQRWSKLSWKRFETRGVATSPEDVGNEDIERNVREFSEAVMNFLKLRTGIVQTQRAIEKSLKNLQRAQDGHEISTLIGPTLLADQKEYVKANMRLVNCFDERVAPAVPKMERIVKWAGELTDLAKWFGGLVNRNLEQGEDDFTRMIVAIRDNNVEKFNQIYERAQQRIETEEQKESAHLHHGVQ